MFNKNVQVYIYLHQPIINIQCFILSLSSIIIQPAFAIISLWVCCLCMYNFLRSSLVCLSVFASLCRSRCMSHVTALSLSAFHLQVSLIWVLRLTVLLTWRDNMECIENKSVHLRTYIVHCHDDHSVYSILYQLGAMNSSPFRLLFAIFNIQFSTDINSLEFASGIYEAVVSLLNYSEHNYTRLVRRRDDLDSPQLQGTPRQWLNRFTEKRWGDKPNHRCLMLILIL